MFGRPGRKIRAVGEDGHENFDPWLHPQVPRRGPLFDVTPADRLDIYARACGLTRRESEVLALLCEGLDTREIAEQMVVSEYTAGDHLKAILAKTGARTRQLLLARGLGTR